MLILDFQHFYEMGDKDHEKLMAIINNTFNGKLVPYRYDMTKLSLEYLTDENKFQVHFQKVIFCCKL